MSSITTTLEERRRLSTWRLCSRSPRSSSSSITIITTSSTNQEETLGSPKTKLRKHARGSLDMEVRTFLLAAIAFLGFLSGLLGFIAEGKKIVESKVIRLSATECVHSRSPAMVLGLVAAIALLIAQIISNSLGGCICCESGPNDPSRKNTPTVLAISFLTLSWITFSIAFLLLVAGASINDTRDASDNLSTGCFILKSGVFTGAALASFATAILGIAYNVQVFSIRKNMDLTCISNIGTSSSEGANSSITQGALNPQGYSIGKPIFSTEQHMKRIPSSKTKVQESAYGRSAVSNNDFRSLQMVNITTSAGKPGQQARGKNNLQDSREPQIGTKKPTMSPQNYKNPQHYSEDQGENNYYSQNAMQSASAAYMTVVAKANTPMNTRDAHIEQQQASQPAFTRQGVGKVWEQSRYYEGAS